MRLRGWEGNNGDEVRLDSAGLHAAARRGILRWSPGVRLGSSDPLLHESKPDRAGPSLHLRVACVGAAD